MLLIAVVIWTVASIVLLLRVPLGVGVAYVILVAAMYWWWRRRDSARRWADLADARDTLRADPQRTRHSDRPSGRGYGAHSWGQRGESPPTESQHPDSRRRE